MPLMSLAATAIDQPQHRDLVIETMIQYISTDPVVCRVEPGELAEKQEYTMSPVLTWVRSRLGVALEPTHSIFGAWVTEEEAAKFREYLHGML